MATAKPVPPQELEFLRAAGNGKYGDVFFVSIFDGKVAFPRTFSLQRVSDSRYALILGLNPDSARPLQLGSVFLGRLAVAKNGREDADTHRPLPSGSGSNDKIGWLQVENYAAGQFALDQSVFVTDGSDYLWFMGDAVPYAAEVAKVFVSPTGPNPWLVEKMLNKGAERPDDEVNEARCLGRVVRGQPKFTNGVAVGLILFPHDRSASNAFTSLGLRAGDIYSPADRSAPPSLAMLERLLFSTKMNPIAIPILRDGHPIDVRIPAALVKKHFGDCAPAAS